MTKLTILSEAWFDMVKQTNKNTILKLSPTVQDICLNVVVTHVNNTNMGNKQNDNTVELYLRNGLIHKGHHNSAETEVKLSFATLKSLLTSFNTDTILYAFMNGDILVSGNMSQLMSLHIAKFTSEQKTLFNTIIHNSDF